ncbi:microcystin degradation protein MlrC [Mycoplana sp. BE70]|uniref:M81 family metallopeptidase n=1 Tax=Mycoplana sp. BE70 TaxID=2817775 RepID=UPI00285A057A|nr:M81 family metallopeptidase [Mycoplana sp. BE70]MDR6759268.1 microcystin degradation protein MlrC [Mycoplana sp. BE70]
MAAPRILLASLLHETNSFNRTLTPIDSFCGRYLLLDHASAHSTLAGSGTETGGFLAGCAEHGWQSHIAFAAAAGPSGPMVETAFRKLKDRLFEAAREKPDGVLLALHGAMTTEESPDPEGDIASELRRIIGPDVPLVVTLDMHANLSPRLVEAADGMCIYETYPHVDQAETARRAVVALARLLVRPKAGRRLTRALVMRPPMLDAADHGRTSPAGPMNPILARLDALRNTHDLVTGGLTIGFPWADTPNAGPAVVLHAAWDSTVDLPAIARELTDLLWQSRGETQLDFPDTAQAIAEALAGRSDKKPLVLADIADNPAGGAYGDSPNLLRAMIAADLENAAFASICDPEAVAQAMQAGLGGRINVVLGGRKAPEISPPLALSVEVVGLHDGRIAFAGPVLRGVTVDMGPIAVFRHRTIEIVVASRALAITDLQQFRALGIEPAEKSVLALKSRNHHRAAFEPLARKVMLVDAGGIASMQLAKIPYRNLPRPIWPLDPDRGTPSSIRVLEFRHDA